MCKLVNVIEKIKGMIKKVCGRKHNEMRSTLKLNIIVLFIEIASGKNHQMELQW